MKLHPWCLLLQRATGPQQILACRVVAHSRSGADDVDQHRIASFWTIYGGQFPVDYVRWICGTNTFRSFLTCLMASISQLHLVLCDGQPSSSYIEHIH